MIKAARTSAREQVRVGPLLADRCFHLKGFVLEQLPNECCAERRLIGDSASNAGTSLEEVLSKACPNMSVKTGGRIKSSTRMRQSRQIWMNSFFATLPTACDAEATSHGSAARFSIAS